jgi:hypothetical protein
MSLIAIVLLLPSGSWAAEKEAVKLTLEDIKVADETIGLPSAVEILSNLQKSNIKFTPDTANSDISKYTTKEQRSLNLGRLISQAAVSVTVKDADSLSILAYSIEALGKTFGVSGTIEKRREKIIDFVKKGDWDQATTEVVQLESWVKQEIVSLRNPDAVRLANVGGWITGLYLATKGLMGNYTPEASKILRAPALTADLIAQMAKLPENLQTGVSKQIMTALPEIKRLVSVNQEESISLESVKELNRISSGLVKAMAE